MDASSYAPLVKSIHKLNWEVDQVKPNDRGLTDTKILVKYAKGRHPVITTDKTMWKENPAEGGATAFIVHGEVSRDQMENLKVTITDFLAQHTSKTVRGKQWELGLDGSVTSKDL